MSSISIKGILIGSLFDLIATLALSFALLIAVAVSTGCDLEVAGHLATSGPWLVLGLAVGSALTVVAGYLAARIAGRGELINGTLCAVLSLMVGLLFTLGEPMFLLEPWALISYAMTPLLGLLGGYLRLRQRLRTQPS